MVHKSTIYLPPASSVSSLNGETGAVTLTSTGGTITITASGSTIDLEAVSTGSITGSGTATQLAYFNGTTSLTSNAALFYGPTLTANNGRLSVGAGVWDGTSTGHFVGSSSGTSFAINEAISFNGRLIDAQLRGISLFNIDVNAGTTATTFNTPGRYYASGTTSGKGYFILDVGTVNYGMVGGVAGGGINYVTAGYGSTNDGASMTSVLYVGNNKFSGVNSVPVSPWSVAVAPTATASYGTLSLGGGPAWDGATSGHFAGNSSGTTIAINEITGYAGDLLNLQINGVSQSKVDSAGLGTFNRLKTIATTSSIVADYGGNGTNIVFRTADSATTSAIFSSSSLDSAWHCFTLQNRSDSSVSIFQMINSSGGVMAAFSQLGSLGIGPNAISSPAHAGRLVIEDSVGGGAGSVGAQITNTNGAGEAFLSVNSDAGQLSIENFGSTFVTTSLRNSGSITANSGLTSGFNFLVLANAPLGFYTNSTQRGQFTAGGSFTVGNGTTGNLIIDSTGAITKISGTTNANLNSGQLALNNPGGQVFLTSTGSNTSVGLAIAGSAKFLVDPTVYNTKTLTIANDYTLAFSSTTSVQGAVDIGLSRSSAGVLALGNGTATNASGALLLAKATVSGLASGETAPTTSGALVNVVSDANGLLSFQSLQAQPSILSTTTGINGVAIANTALYTVPAGKTAIITDYIVRVSAATAVTIGPSAGIGNVAGTNNISASQTMTTLTTTTSNFQWQVIGASISTAAAGVIYFNIGTGATGTSETLAVDLIGYLV